MVVSGAGGDGQLRCQLICLRAATSWRDNNLMTFDNPEAPPGPRCAFSRAPQSQSHPNPMAVGLQSRCASFYLLFSRRRSSSRLSIESTLVTLAHSKFYNCQLLLSAGTHLLVHKGAKVVSLSGALNFHSAPVLRALSQDSSTFAPTAASCFICCVNLNSCCPLRFPKLEDNHTLASK